MMKHETCMMSSSLCNNLMFGTVKLLNLVTQTTMVLNIYDTDTPFLFNPIMAIIFIALLDKTKEPLKQPQVF